MIARQNMLQFIATRDLKLMRKVNKWPAPRWVRRVAIVATRAGDGWLWYLTGLAILFLGGAERLTAVASAGSAALVGVGLFTSLKKLSGRKRPCEIEPHCWATLLPPDQFSFPIGPHHHRVCGSHSASANFIPCCFRRCSYALS